LVAAAADSDPLRGLGGIRVRLEVAVVLPQGTAIAQKTLVFRLPDSPEAPNHGFQIAGLRVRRLTHAHDESPSLYPPWPDEEEVAAGDLVHFDVFDKGWLRPILAAAPGADAAVEEYDTTDLGGRRVHVRETITYSFFASFGDISG